MVRFLRTGRPLGAECHKSARLSSDPANITGPSETQTKTCNSPDRTACANAHAGLCREAWDAKGLTGAIQLHHVLPSSKGYSTVRTLGSGENTVRVCPHVTVRGTEAKPSFLEGGTLSNDIHGTGWKCAGEIFFLSNFFL